MFGDSAHFRSIAGCITCLIFLGVGAFAIYVTFIERALLLFHFNSLASRLLMSCGAVQELQASTRLTDLNTMDSSTFST
jgi:hypothetical protein